MAARAIARVRSANGRRARAAARRPRATPIVRESTVAKDTTWSTDRPLGKGADIALKEGQRLTLSVPATSANMGPGFDSFGFAVDLHNELILERGPFEVVIEGEGADDLPRDESNAIIKAVKAGYESVRPGETLPSDIKYTSVNRIPPARGLGSSSAALVSGLAAGLALAGQDVDAPQTKQHLLQLASDIEGHPDNVAPAIYGGFQVSINTGSQWVTQSIALPEGLQAVLFIPEFQSLTAETRAALPKEIPVSDAVFNISRAAMLINSFATGNMEALRYACQDIIHQPIRGEAFGLDKLIDAALGRGAHGVFLSGAGPTVLALTGGHGSDLNADTMVTFMAVEVAEAMSKAAADMDLKGRSVIASPTATGVESKRDYAYAQQGMWN